MHITAYCPSCRSRYQLDVALRGQRIRCPNPVCREIFEVQADQAEAATPPPTEGEPPTTPVEVEPSDRTRPQQELGASPPGTVTTGKVGDLVPILEAEVVHEIPPPAPPADLPPTPIVVQETVPLKPDQDEDAKPIPVDDSLLPKPIEVENLVPLEPDEEARAQPIQEAPSWHVPPPIRNPAALGSQPAEPAEVSAPQPPSRPSKRSSKKLPMKLPEEAPPAWQSPPPIRRDPSQPFPEPSAAPPLEPLEPSSFPAPSTYPEIEPSRTSRRALWIIGAMVLVAGFVIATVVVVTLNAYVRTEGNIFTQAQKEYEDGKYASAASTYQNLVKDFPNSEFRSLYQLLAELSQLRDQVYTAQADPQAALEAANRFLAEHKNDVLLKPYTPDLWQTLGKLAEQLAVLAKQEHNADLLAKAKETREQSIRYRPRDRDDPDAARKLIAQAETDITQWRKKQELLKRLGQWLQEPASVQIVNDARSLARREGFDQDPEIKNGIHQLEMAVRLTVRYVASGERAAPAQAEAVESSLLIVPPVVPPATTVGRMGNPSHPMEEGRHAVFALARGVLYALDQSTGRDLWATRVGIDTTTLPVRLPAVPPSPELLLVLSADRNMIMALDALTGRLAWQSRLSAACLGRPVVVNRRAFVPTYDGRVYEIETAQGYVLGHFELGQPLTVGGVWQEGTDLLYFPGDSDFVYVLDAAFSDRLKRTPQCVAILHTGHPSGSLRSEPILINRVDPFAKDGGANPVTSYLILTQTDGMDQMKLRVFGLPIEGPESPPLLRPEPPIRGWSWFPPYHDGERIAFATDAGRFGLFGINQVRNEDKPLFPELPEPPEPKQKPVSADTGLIRGQVVHVVENDFWVLAEGKLQRWHFDRFGPRMVPVWEVALPLGSPMHAAQIDENEKTIFVVTQDLSRQIYLATAVAAESGVIQWQRQLGLEGQGDPLVVGQEVITIDRGGGLCILDSSTYKHQEEREWRSIDPVYASALPGGPITAYLLPGPDGSSVYEVACPASGSRLTVRHYQRGQGGKQPVEATVALRRPLAGTPAIVGQSLLLPLADGTIRRFALPLADRPSEGGPEWRAARVDENARGHIVALGADEFLTTNGSRGLTHWRWANDPSFQTVPEGKIPTVELPARIISVPVVIPSPKGDADWQVCVADAEGNLTLLRGPDLKAERPWPPLGGKITAGPFRRGQYLGCVVDRRRLIWFDPSKAERLWEYRTPGEGIVGEPQLVGDLVLVADLSGGLIGLDPATGKAVGPSYTLKTSAAPAAAPVAFGADVAFVPLTDGTVFLLALEHLRDPTAGP